MKLICCVYTIKAKLRITKIRNGELEISIAEKNVFTGYYNKKTITLQQFINDYNYSAVYLEVDCYNRYSSKDERKDLPTEKTNLIEFLTKSNRKWFNLMYTKPIIKHNQNAKYLSYYFHSEEFNKQKKKLAHGAKVIEVTPSALEDIIINLPDMEEQNRIVEILDRFDSLCNDIAKGIPAEIKAREQQYEYYRDKLLSFTNLEA